MIEKSLIEELIVEIIDNRPIPELVFLDDFAYPLYDKGYEYKEVKLWTSTPYQTNEKVSKLSICAQLK